MKTFLRKTIFLISVTAFFSKVCCQCEFPNNKLPAKDLKAYQKLKPLIGKRFQIEGPNHEYTFHIGICTNALAGEDGDAKHGIVQIKNKDNTRHVIGEFSNSGIMAGTNWVYLEYGNGDTYSSDEHCQKANRKAVILFTCDPKATDSTKPRMLEEQKNMSFGCYYLFEMACPEVCENPPGLSSLSIGSIILIVFFCVASVYLIAGALYQRLVLGAKGIEQIPNYEFWKDFGNLQADGCDFVCRSHDARRSSPYKGLGDDQLEEPEERDDNLLPM